MPTPRTHACSVSTCDILFREKSGLRVSTCHVFCLSEPLYSELRTMDKQIKRVVSYYRTTHRRGDKAGSVLLRTVEEIKRVVSYYRTTYRRGDKAGSVLLPYYVP